MPSYYAGESFVQLIPFKDHINIEAKAVSVHREDLPGYKITPKGMLQVFLKQELPREVLKRIFSETLGRQCRYPEPGKKKRPGRPVRPRRPGLNLCKKKITQNAFCVINWS